MKKLSIILIIITFALVTTAILFNLKPDKINNNYDLESVIQEVTKNTQLIDANSDHNQALDVAEYANKNNIHLPEIIINFDTHSDVYLNDPGILPEAGVEDWINEYIAKNPQVDTLYWVMPDEEANNLIMQVLMGIKTFEIPKEYAPLFGNSLKKMNPFYFVFNPVYKQTYTQNFLINPKTKYLNEYIEGNKLNNRLFGKFYDKYKKVTVITCTKDTLPNLNGKKIFLSIDADYLSNSGFDTTGFLRFIKSDSDIDKTYYTIFETIKDKNIKPVVISMSLSPQYLPKSKHKYVMSLFEKTIKYSDMKDIISTYKHRYDPKRYE